MTKRKVRPLRLLAVILGGAFAVYVLLCAFQFVATAVEAISKNAKSESKRPDPEFADFTGQIKEYNSAVLMYDERVSVDQSLMLINRSHLIRNDFSPEISEYKGTGLLFNNCLHEAFSALSYEVSEQFGEKLYVSSAYRTAEEQKREIEEQGEVAQDLGASEHQAGLAADVYTLYHGGMGFEGTETGKWVIENCWQYGFILRYPEGKEDKTGIEYEPWHLRYVGAPHAEYMTKAGLTFEEYIDSLEPEKLYKITTGDGEYAVVRYSGDTLSGPESFESAVISDDNTGSRIATFLIKSAG